ncbi:MAG: DUF1553 domain-containing protein [Gemmataceae bacterium]
MPSLRCILALVVALPLIARAEPAPAFEREVAPLLRDRCLKCHNAKTKRGDLDLSSRAALLAGGAAGPGLKPGKSAESLLFQHVRDHKMPPRQPLADREIALLRRWIESGAKWEGGDLRAAVVVEAGRAGPDWWSLQPIRRLPVPSLKQASLARTPIDAFLLDKLQARGLTFSPEADRPTLIRRLYFDLLGLAPTPEEVDAFVADTRPDAYERLVDHLLASPHHGERYARHWLDVVRFAESHGYEMNTLRPTAWPYRDYVIRAFNSDLPYRQFIREQLGGDVLGGGDFLTSAATGFLVAGAHDMVGNATLEGKRQQRADDLYDLVATTGAAFLGLTVGCARCHDHKFDPVTMKDFYALQAVFAGIDHAERVFQPADERSPQLARLRQRLAEIDRTIDTDEPLYGSTRRAGVQPRRNVERFAPASARFVRFSITATTDGTEPCIDELELYGPDEPGNLALASRGAKPSASSTYPNSPIHRLDHLHDGLLGNSRSWISAERGKGWVQLELPRAVRLDRVVWGRDREERFRDRLARAYRIELSLDGKTWQLAAASDDRQPPGAAAPNPSTALQREKQQIESDIRRLTEPVKIYAGTFRTPDVVHRLKRGDVMQPQEVIGPAGIEAIQPPLQIPPAASESARRLALADWLAHPANPLPARVMVNRLWQAHFGAGLVATPSDFGFNGARPTHPELLDWLASEFQAGDGTLKRLHRLLVLSHAYRQESRSLPTAVAVDAGNTLLWRMRPRRLEAEAIRDSMLQTSGSLDTTMGGPGYNLWDYSGYVIVFQPKKQLGPAEFRRMVYQFKPRLQQDGTFGAFDCPDATTTAPRRNVSTTALQALNLFNDPFVLDQADRLAARLKREAGTDPAAQATLAFRLAFGRTPAPDEHAAALALLREHGAALLARVLYNSNEFVFVR